ncbi:MAG: SGNH/GDSL hydrolase family protein [Lunatimonas sp.]|nr:SGNH/GDSL hydrolase family protein [Lunatimonas sp.]
MYDYCQGIIGNKKCLIDMKIYSNFINSLLVLLILVFSSAVEKKPRILIIGDSISGGYTRYVTDHFKDRAVVMHNPGNAGDTGKGLTYIREYIGNGDWDIILFNWGLHDLCYRHPDSKSAGNRDKVNGTITFTVDKYKENLESLVGIMKELSDAKLVFVTTTFVPENEPGRFSKDPIIYNKVALQVMKDHSVTVKDIYKKSKVIHKEHGFGDDDVHFTDAGNKELSKLIVEVLEKVLN